MTRYRCTFYGRKVGAIGIKSWYELTIDAPDPEAARLKLYDTHEHIEGLRVVPLEGGPRRDEDAKR